jgi:F-type H+-transporting ATPase subunit alpha
MKKGRDVLIIFDDLYKHAIAYRNISLILKRPPGRESYPGDIFYLHSRLLERAGKYIIDEKKNICGSITAFPIMETQYGDISSYISTNLISITDGQIFTNSELFNNNQKPAIDIGLSVSRIGSAAQEKIIKKLSSSLKIDLSNYLELLIFNKFNVDMDKESVAIINRGKKIMNIMTQNKNSPYTFFEQVIILLIIFGNIIEKINPDTITDFIHLLLKELGKNNKCKKINN